MTEVTFHAFPDGRISLQVSGHARFGTKGQDIVCAAVSALALTAAEAAKTQHRQRMLAERPVTVLRSGFALISVRPKRRARQQVRQQLRVIEAGLRLLEGEFPRYVQVKGHL